MRIGSGWDLHQLKEGKKLVLGGVEIPFHRGEEAHSDGDVLIHAVIDALLGAAALGDIGTHFPPSDEKYRGISSMILLNKTNEYLREAGYLISNIDATIIIEEPRLKPYISDIRNNLAETLSILPERVSVKAKTKEKMDATGQGLAVEAFASVLIEETDASEWV